MKGFTFVELMVSISIILILVLLSFPFYVSINKQLTIDRAATRLVQDIRKAMEMTMSAKEFNNEYPDGGYGIHFPGGAHPTDKYYLFADGDGDHTYDAGELVEEVKMARGIRIRKMYFPPPKSFANVIFVPPEPIVFLTKPDGSSLSVALVFVNIYDSDGNRYSIYINKVGLVYIQ